MIMEIESDTFSVKMAVGKPPMQLMMLTMNDPDDDVAATQTNNKSDVEKILDEDDIDYLASRVSNIIKPLTRGSVRG